MKKFFQEIFNKWFIGIAVAFLMMFGTAAIDYFNRFFSLPQAVEENRTQRIKDSTLAWEEAIKINMRLDKIERRNLLDSIYLEEDFRTLEKLKLKTKIK